MFFVNCLHSSIMRNLGQKNALSLFLELTYFFVFINISCKMLIQQYSEEFGTNVCYLCFWNKMYNLKRFNVNCSDKRI